MWKIAIIFIMCCVCIIKSVALVSYGLCQLETKKEPGYCVRFEDCQTFLDLIVSGGLNSTVIETMRRSQCGLDAEESDAGRQFRVCCPDSFTNSTQKESTQEIPAGNALPKPGTCGVALNMRIFGGDVTHIDEFPWLVLIKYLTSFNVSLFPCGGALISSRYVLTAAHCIKNRGIAPTWTLHSVRLGEWNRESDPDCEIDNQGNQYCAPTYIEIGIEVAIVHPDYLVDSPNHFHDIALVRMAESVVYNNFVRPICLPTLASLRYNSFVGAKAEAAGWGSSENSSQSNLKLKLTLEIVNTAKCKERFSTIGTVINETFQMCAGGEANKDTCRGDSGGPLTISHDYNGQNAFYVIGIISHGLSKCGLENWYGVYTRLDSYVDWVLRNLAP